MDSVSVVYVGPYPEVEVPFDGGWLTITKGVPTDVPRRLAEGGVTYDADDQITSNVGGLLEQEDLWQLAKPAKTKSAKAGSTEE